VHLRLAFGIACMEEHGFALHKAAFIEMSFVYAMVGSLLVCLLTVFAARVLVLIMP